MDSVEQLREALYELNQQRINDLAQLEQSQAVLAGLERISAAASPSEALDALLSSVRTSTGCDAALLLECTATTTTLITSTDPAIETGADIAPGFFNTRAKRIVDLSALKGQAGALARDGHYRSMISAPFTTASGAALVLVCLSGVRAGLTTGHQNIAKRLIALASQTLETKKLTDENALLAQVLNSSSASFSIADADDQHARLIYVNDAFEQLTGYTRAEVLNQNCRFLSAEPPDSAIRQSIRTTVAQRQTGQFEVRNRRKSGELFWNNLSIFPVHAGDKTYIVATQWDLTSRVEAEAERDMARQQLVSALGSVKEGILLLDAEDRIVFSNPRFEKFHNLSEGALEPGQPLITAWSRALQERGLPEEQAKDTSQKQLDALKAPTVQRERHLASGFQVLETHAPTPEGGTISVLSDVTALKVAQKQLSERVAAIDSMQDGMAIMDLAGRMFYLNPSHQQMFGYEKTGDLIGRKWALLYHPDQMAFLEDVAIPAMAETGQWRGDVIGRRRDGTPVAHEVTLTKLADAGLICVTRDITERIQIETERGALRDQLTAAQRQEAIGQMAAGLAHDFNNCLSVVSGSAALVQEARTEKERDQHAQRILQASEKAAELTGRLLRFGARNSHREALDIRDPLQSALDLVRSSIKTAVALTLDLPRQPLICDIDPTDVLQVVINLVINARDAIGDTSGRIAVGLEEISGGKLAQRSILGEIDTAQRYAAVHVEDDGGGIKTADPETLFEAYVTTKSDQGGTGLGLSVVRSLVLAGHGGIEVNSTPGEGTRFSIYWPLTSRAGGATAATAQHIPATSLQDRKVMVVDDDTLVGETIATFLEHAGCEVVTCDDPNDALEAITAEPAYWETVVTDYDMPGLNGAELAEKLRMIAPNLPIILCTALPVLMGSDRVGTRLFTARLSKPVDAKKLVAQVSRAIEGKDA